MKTHPTRRCLAAALLAASGTCWATLGEPMAAPAGATSESAHSPGGARYTVLANRLDSGTEVREYANAQGIVFAVSWNGPFLLDLRSLLGSHFAALEQHSAGAGRASAVSIQTPELTLLSGGRMGAFRGRAWLPRQLPAGVDPRALP
jgi:hypothetical protein